MLKLSSIKNVIKFKRSFITYILLFLASLTCYSVAYAGFMNYLELSIDNRTEYLLSQFENTNNSKGDLLSIEQTLINPKSESILAHYSANFLGQLSQELTLKVFDQSGLQVGACRIHTGIGSYAAYPDFSGSYCKLDNKDDIQFNPSYTMQGDTYNVTFKLAKAASFSRIIIFGDSMSDTGNLYKRSVEISLIFPYSPILPLSPPYYNGRFTNGPVWVELLSRKLNLPRDSMLNYAYAGASVKRDLLPIPNLTTQVNKYLNWNKTGDPFALYIVWMGCNDIMRRHDEPIDLLVNSIQSGVELNLKKLLDRGAKRLLVPQLPDISMNPDSLSRDKNAGNHQYTDKIQQIIKAYNTKLSEVISRLEKQYPDATLMTFDLFEFIQEAKDAAEEFGFTNTQDRCNPNDYWEGELEVCAKPSEYVFWDGVHPSAQVHALLGELMFQIVTHHGYTPNKLPVKLVNAKNDEVVIRNKKAIDELNKEIDFYGSTSNSNNKGFRASIYTGANDLSLIKSHGIELY